jgi:hypothetical protein
MVRVGCLSALAVLPLIACGPSPRYANTSPAPASATAAPRPASEIDLFASSETAGGGGDFALPLVADDMMTLVPPPTSPVRIGDVRTDDLVVGREGYRKFMCGWKPSIHLQEDHDKTLVAATCPDPHGAGEKRASYPLVLKQLDELRHKAGAMGARAVVDVRCFVFSDRYRLWCEGTAVTGASP